jgi:hypothetical protein
MTLSFVATLLVAISGGVGGTLMALGFLNPRYFDRSHVQPTENLARAFVVTGAIFAIVFGIGKLAFFFSSPSMLP